MTTRRRFGIACLAALCVGVTLPLIWDDLFAKRVAVVEPGRILRGAWQKPGPLRRLVDRERVRTVVTLTAINPDDPKYVAQAEALRDTGVDWIIIPMRGSTATLEQMTEVADLIADPARQPVFFHCVGGHHRSNLVHAAYRIRHRRLSAKDAWDEVSALPWSRPDRDLADRAKIYAFASRKDNKKDSPDDKATTSLDSQGRSPRPLADRGILRAPVGEREFRDR